MLDIVMVWIYWYFAPVPVYVSASVSRLFMIRHLVCIAIVQTGPEDPCGCWNEIQALWYKYTNKAGKVHGPETVLNGWDLVMR